MFNESAFIEVGDNYIYKLNFVQINKFRLFWVSVDDLLFHGYQDPMISAICNHRVTRSVCKKENIPERIGLFYQVQTSFYSNTRLGLTLTNLSPILHKHFKTIPFQNSIP